jgi:alkanesulfonate monooxygenase SsuD/methylene tetrahydromethanopterin reductase-like flavin-dependent oxidoreductase (luciferase family)
MIGSTGERVLGIALPHVDTWNTWYNRYANTAEGFAALNDRISDLAEKAGRDPSQVQRSACVLVDLDPDAVRRPIDEGLEAVDGGPKELASHLRALAEAGADEAILVVRPITEASIRALGEALRVLDG